MLKLALSPIPMLGAALDEAIDQRRRRAETLASETLAASGPERLVERLRGDDEYAELFLAGLEAAMRTTSEAKLSVVGRALAHIAMTEDDAAVSTDAMVVRALVDLDVVHFRALGDLVRAEYARDEHERVAGQTGEVGIQPDSIPTMVSPVLAGLLRHGAVRDQTGWGAAGVRSTTFGRDLLSRLGVLPPGTSNL